MRAGANVRTGIALAGVLVLGMIPGRALADGAVGGNLGLSFIQNERLDHRPVFGVYFLNSFGKEVSLRLDLSYLSGSERFDQVFAFPTQVDTVYVTSEIITSESSLSLGPALSMELWKSPKGHLLRGSAGIGIHRRTAHARAAKVTYEKRQKEVSLQFSLAVSGEWRIPGRPYFFLGEAKYATFSDFEQAGAVPLSDLERDDLITVSVGFGYRFVSPHLFRPHGR